MIKNSSKIHDRNSLLKELQKNNNIKFLYNVATANILKLKHDNYKEVPTILIETVEKTVEEDKVETKDEEEDEEE